MVSTPLRSISQENRSVFELLTKINTENKKTLNNCRKINNVLQKNKGALEKVNEDDKAEKICKPQKLVGLSLRKTGSLT